MRRTDPLRPLDTSPLIKGEAGWGSALLLTFAISFLSFGQLQAKPIQVMVSILPQVEFVKAVGKERVDVTPMIPVGANDEMYEPSPHQIALLSKSKLYVRIGLIAFETSNFKRLQQVNPKMIVLDASQGVELIGSDPHIWMSPRRMIPHIHEIANALSSIDPKSKEFFETNAADYIKKLEELDKNIQSAKKTQRKLLMFHPFLGYFSKDYGFQQFAIEVDGKPPTPRQMQSILREAKKAGLRDVIVQKQFGKTVAKTVADALGGTVIEIDPLAPDYISNMQSIVTNLK